MSGGLTPEQHRELAARLQAAGVVSAAADAYAAYLDSGAVNDPEARANVAYQVGRMLMEAGRTEEALSWLYRVEMLDPDTPLKAEVGTRIVQCLERLGRHGEASRALDARTAREGDPRGAAQEQASEAIARLGAEEITRADVDAALDALPAPLRRQVQEDEAQWSAFARQYLAQEVLWRKARKEGLHQEPEVRRQLDQLEKVAVVNELIRRRVERELRLDEADARNYFEAHRDRYAGRDGQVPAWERVRERVLRDYAAEKQDRIAQALFEEALSGGDVRILDPRLASPPPEAAAEASRGGAP